MPPRNAARRQPCDTEQARVRLRDAYAQLELADLTSPTGNPHERNAAISSAVLAGIAAADAASCAILGERSRSQNHRDAAGLLRAIVPGGADAARHFERLIALKDAAQYGFEDLSGQALTAAGRHAKALISFAERVLER